MISEPSVDVVLSDSQASFSESWASTLSSPDSVSYVLLFADTDRNYHNGGYFLLRSPLPPEGSREFSSADLQYGGPFSILGLAVAGDSLAYAYAPGAVTVTDPEKKASTNLSLITIDTSPEGVV